MLAGRLKPNKAAKKQPQIHRWFFEFICEAVVVLNPFRVLGPSFIVFPAQSAGLFVLIRFQRITRESSEMLGFGFSINSKSQFSKNK